MHAARGPRRPDVLPFVAPVPPCSQPITVFGIKFKIVGPTNTPPAEGAYHVAPTLDGNAFYYLSPVDPSRD